VQILHYENVKINLWVT